MAEVMRVEKNLGFRSSFNFVGRDYAVPGPLLADLKAEGFEVGVHGLHHNGFMYITEGHLSEACARDSEVHEGMESPRLPVTLHAQEPGVDARPRDHI